MPETTSKTQTGRIQALPETLINQIAAGEVVERPASVVKELVENSVDSGASKVEILIKDGGISEITVVDDGCGMAASDLELCVERHTTSKLRELTDLESLSTFGFRGEALSSVSSVAKVEIKSRPANTDHGQLLKVALGNKQGLEPTACPQGTQISVRELFETLPARRKFLRAASTELSHCVRVVKELALANAGVSFYLSHQARQIHKFPAATRETRFKQCTRYPWTPMHLQSQNDDLDLEAFLSPPSLIADKGDVTLVINGRVVVHRAVLSAVRRAYADTVGPHHAPSGVVYLDLRKDWVDVNVHPQKLEVRLLKQERLYPWLAASIRKAIGAERAPKEVYIPVPRAPEPVSLTESSAELLEEQTEEAEEFSLPMVEKRPAPVQPTLDPVPLVAAPKLKYLGQMKASYLLCEDDEGLLIVDQHALHEKQKFEQLWENFEAEAAKTQILLIPKIITLPIELLSIVTAHRDIFKKVGFEIEVFGDAEIAIKSCPSYLEEKQIEEVIRETLDELVSLGEGAKPSLEKALRPIFATLACHSVVRFNQRLSDTEATSLLRGIDKLELGWTCPHGRPVLFRLNYSSIERHFER